MLKHDVFLSVRMYALAVGVAAAVAWLAYDGGSYSIASRTTLGIALWFAIAAAFALRLLPIVKPTRAALLAGGALAALAALTLLSTLWAANAEKTVLEFDRVVVYLGVFAVLALVVTRASAGRWADGIALGIVAICLISLANRFFFPDEVSRGPLTTLLPTATARLAYPIGYWNALGVFAAVGLPLLLRAAIASSRSLARAAAVAAVPAVASVVYLTSSRNAALVAFLGVAVFLAGSARWDAVVATAVAGAGAAAALAVLLTQDALVNDPTSRAAFDAGPTAAALVLLACVATAGAAWIAGRYAGRSLRVPRRPAIALAAVAAVVVAASVAAARPVERLTDFTEPPAAAARGSGAINEHLVSASGTGRWQTWQAAVEAWRTRPLAGRGAGSYEAWWAAHGTLAGRAQNAHSFYLETLAELGVLGLAAVAILVGTGLVVGVRRVLAAAGDARVLAAALLASFAAYAVAAGIDWLWQVTAVSVVAVMTLALLTGSATAPVSVAGAPGLSSPLLADRRLIAVDRRTPRRGLRWPSGRLAAVAVALVGSVLVVAQVVPLVADVRIRASQRAVARGDTGSAAHHALAARNLEPWAPTPYLQLALVAEQQRDLDAAHRWIGKAIDRDASDWRLWLVATRIELERGRVDAARRTLRRAVQLNPRSPLWNEFSGLIR